VHQTAAAGAEFPLPLSAYTDPAGASLLEVLQTRIEGEPLNLVATVIFFLAIAHTFLAARFTALAHRVQHKHDMRLREAGEPATPSIHAEFLHFVGEVEVIFGLWVVPLLISLTLGKGWTATTHYLNDTVNYTEPIFVVVIMVLASTRPVVLLAETSLRRIAQLGGCTPGAWWITILTIGPILGSFITEPAAMTICALLLARQFFDLQPSGRLRYATLGLLFVNVSIGGTLTHFAAPPVLMVARPWEWDMSFMLTQFGWRAVAAIIVSTVSYYLLFKVELRELAQRAPIHDVEQPSEDIVSPRVALLPVPTWIVVSHLAFMAWTVFNSHYPSLFVGGFLFFLGFSRATAPFQGRLDLKPALLVGFFLGGLVIHGGLQAWWIAPVLATLRESPLFFGSALLTAFNDNALITYLGTLVPSLDDGLKVALVGGAVTGGGLTVIANAPNPAGQALLARFFGGAVQPLRLLLAALFPTLVAAALFRLI
jgi:hypothetical protein